MSLVRATSTRELSLAASPSRRPLGTALQHLRFEKPRIGSNVQASFSIAELSYHQSFSVAVDAVD